MKLRSMPIAGTAALAALSPAVVTAAPGIAPDLQPPVEFTACVEPGPIVTEGTSEQTVVSMPGGEMTVEQRRGSTFELRVSEVSDPRLDGAWFHSSDDFAYTSANDGQGAVIASYSRRIENDDGAWQGSGVMVRFPDETPSLWRPMYAVVGEGAYEGLTAVIAQSWSSSCPNTRGYVFEGKIPEPPVPDSVR